ncbi:hypothetical protein BDR03DRAFT_384629 [Suillus americanus]|nr:hypothetical protein BDR03DRAFT_384629 [Suillus americanus]
MSWMPELSLDVKTAGRTQLTSKCILACGKNIVTRNENLIPTASFYRSLNTLSKCATRIQISARGYNDNPYDVPNQAAKKIGWLQERHDFLSLFSALFPDLSQPQIFDLGRCWVRNYKMRLLALSGEPDCPVNREP